VHPLSIDCANAVPEISAVSASAARNVAIAPLFITALLVFSENMVSHFVFSSNPPEFCFQGWDSLHVHFSSEGRQICIEPSGAWVV
jgi:hypothetical protein